VVFGGAEKRPHAICALKRKRHCRFTQKEDFYNLAKRCVKTGRGNIGLGMRRKKRKTTTDYGGRDSFRKGGEKLDFPSSWKRRNFVNDHALEGQKREYRRGAEGRDVFAATEYQKAG